MTIHEAAEDTVRAWVELPMGERMDLGKRLVTADLHSRMMLLHEAVESYRMDQTRRAEYPHPLQGLGDEHELSGPLTEIPMAQIVVRSDGGPWAVHNQPCAVCGERKAVLDLNLGVFTPCWPCMEKGWDLKCSRPRWWQKRYRSRLGVSE